MKKTLLLIAFISAIFTANAQDTAKACNWKMNAAADLVSRYVWRGLDFGAAPNIQPTLAFSNGNFEIGYWGSVSILGNYSEADLYAKYTIKNFSIIATDYFFPIDGVPSIAYEKYFNYASNSTNHIFEGTLQYKGGEKFPISVLAATYFFGNDKDENGDLRFSTYAELGYSFSLAENNFDVFIGGTPTESAYGSKAGIVNLGLTGYREIKITDDYSLPVKASVITNPQIENIYFVFGITF